MSELRIEVPTACSAMDQLRPGIDEALAEQFPGGLLERRWEGEVLVLSGPGAKGTIRLVDGHLRGEATLAPPATLLRSMIEEKMTAALRAVAEAE